MSRCRRFLALPVPFSSRVADGETRGGRPCGVCHLDPVPGRYMLNELRLLEATKWQGSNGRRPLPVHVSAKSHMSRCLHMPAASPRGLHIAVLTISPASFSAMIPWCASPASQRFSIIAAAPAATARALSIRTAALARYTIAGVHAPTPSRIADVETYCIITFGSLFTDDDDAERKLERKLDASTACTWSF